MASACISSHSYLYPTSAGSSTGSHYLQDPASGSQSRASSRPSTSSSYSSSVAYPLSATSTHSNSALQPSPVSPYPSPTSPALTRMRPLPTPPATPSSSLSTGPPRPLPKPPLHRAQSHHTFEPPLPTQAQAPSTRRVPPGISTPPRDARIPPPLQSAPPERPSIRLNITDFRSSGPITSTQNVASPLSPIAFNLPGPRTLRKRREEELARRMKALGFVEAPSPTGDFPKSGARLKPGPSSYSRGFGQRSSSTFTESDDERDVVLLVENDSDMDDHHPIQPPPRNASRAAMLSLFPDDSDPSPPADGTKMSFLDAPPYAQKGNPWKAGDADEYGARTPGHLEVRVDVDVELVTKEAVARTKRRFSRKWVRERKGKRWTERDFGEILVQLRKLR